MDVSVMIQHNPLFLSCGIHVNDTLVFTSSEIQGQILLFLHKRTIDQNIDI